MKKKNESEIEDLERRVQNAKKVLEMIVKDKEKEELSLQDHRKEKKRKHSSSSSD